MAVALVASAIPGVALSKEKPSHPVTFQLEVPSPGWEVEITGLYRKDNRLLVVARASTDGGPAAAVITTREATAFTDAASARLPKEFYLLGREWNWGEGYTPVSTRDLKELLKGAKKVSASKEAAPADADFVGLRLRKAKGLADRHGIVWRVVVVDGRPRAVTQDHRPDRLNFTVVKDKVTKVSRG